ncbi:tetratricopeptide repeat protein [soil metagenome]
MPYTDTLAEADRAVVTPRNGGGNPPDPAQLEAQGDLIGALAAYTEKIAVDPSDPSSWTRIGMILVRLMKWQPAADNFRFVLSLDPNHAEALHGLAISLYHLGESTEARSLADAAADAAPTDWRIHATRAYIHATTLGDPAATLAVYRDWAARFADPLTDASTPLPRLRGADASPTRRLRVGYVSGDLRQHSMAYFIEPVFANHDKSQVEVFVYSTGRRDAVTERLQRHVPNWFNVAATNDDDLLKLIRGHGIDVLVDLSGHTEGQRLFVFARRAAPVQITWLGFMHPLGMRAMDYRLTDCETDGPGADAHYTETLFRLHCMASYAPPESPLLTTLPMQSNGFPTLISLNNSKKVTDRMLAVWGRILAARTDAQLVIMVQERTPEDAQAQMLPRLQRMGLPLDRIYVSPQLPLEEFMALGTVADVALDTSPVSGGTTTLHSLWMGLPVVTLDSPEAAEGSTARTLHALGCDDWVASDEDGYVQRALALLDSPEQLLAHRAGIRDRMSGSLLMDYAGRTRELEHAFRLMWINHLLGERRFVRFDVPLDVAVAAAEAKAEARIGCA